MKDAGGNEGGGGNVSSLASQRRARNLPAVI